jgi:hypothetical protein
MFGMCDWKCVADNWYVSAVKCCDRVIGVLNLMLVLLQTTTLLASVILMFLVSWTFFKRSTAIFVRRLLLLVASFEITPHSRAQFTLGIESTERRHRGSPCARSIPQVAHALFEYRL